MTTETTDDPTTGDPTLDPFALPCRDCGEPSTKIYCYRCADRARCPHGRPIIECDDCDRLADLAFDADREGRR